MNELGKQSHDIVKEFRGVALGDVRRVRRLESTAAKLSANPGHGFPQALVDEADLEGFYRLLRNAAVTFEALFDPHVKASVDRLAERSEALAVHDTSEFKFGGRRDGLGVLKRKGRGFLGHFTLAVGVDAARAPLGVIASELWVRREPTATALHKAGQITLRQARCRPNEQDRWFRGVKASEAAVSESRCSLIHVMDSEADDYDLMTRLVEGRHRWVIRLSDNRVLANTSAPAPRKIREFVATMKVRCTRDVHLSRRRRPPGGGRRRTREREERNATLGISASPLAFKRSSTCPIAAPEALTGNIVTVRETNPPAGEEPVEWLLFTTEPIDTEVQILRVIDIYRARWRIEEYFKALKTGCAFEKRQLESWQTLKNALGIFVPIAWHLLHLRTLAREDSLSPSRTVLTPIQEKVLRRASKRALPRRMTTKDALLAIAKLGGHQSNNGEPGWNVLGRGFQDLLMMTAGYRLALAEK